MAPVADPTLSPVPESAKKTKKMRKVKKLKSSSKSSEVKSKAKEKKKRNSAVVSESTDETEKTSSVKKSKKPKVKTSKKEKTKSKSKKRKVDAEDGDSTSNGKKKKVKVEEGLNKVKTEEPEIEEEEKNPLLKGARPLSELKAEFKLSSQSLSALEKRGISSLFEIQVKTFQLIRDGKDVIGRARTGMGKTLAFCLPVVETITARGARHRKGRGPAVIVLAPTRELAKQVSREFEETAPHLSTTTVYGGVPLSAQSRAMYLGTDVVVGTPGRILDHIERRTLKLEEVMHLILDEADQMLDMGFKEEMDRVFDAVESQKKEKSVEDRTQTLLFSATLPAWVNDVAQKKMKDPMKIDLVGDMESASKDVTHLCLQCPWHARPNIIADLVKVYATNGKGGCGRTIVFCSTKKECNELAVNQELSSIAKVIHGDIAQTHREATLQGFRSGRFPMLIATDVAARGLDIKGVDLVINSEPPSTNFSGRADVDTYVHRSGRTGRAGKKGVCVTLFKFNQVDLIRTIERATSNTLNRIGAPQASDMLNAAAQATIEQLQEIDDNVLEQFKECAESLVEKMGASKAISAALARITGFDTPKTLEPRSLMSSQQGFVTVQFKHTEALHGLGYVWGALRNILPSEAVEGCRGMAMTADSMGAVLDLPAKYLPKLEELINTGKERKFSVCTELPDLQDNRSRYGNSKNRNGGGRNGFDGRRGGFGGRGRSGRGGWGNRGRGRGRGSSRRFGHNRR